MGECDTGLVTLFRQHYQSFLSGETVHEFMDMNYLPIQAKITAQGWGFGVEIPTALKPFNTKKALPATP